MRSLNVRSWKWSMKNIFELIKTDGRARLGKVHLAHGVVETPIFMPVGTQGTVKTMTPHDLEEIGAQIILANTYHLYLRPGHELVRTAGGLHGFTSWKKPFLTDSGGFQVFSHAGLNKITEDGVYFSSHIDGSKHFFTPELSMEVQNALGADIIMVFDECAPYPAEYGYVAESVKRTTRWEKRSLDAHQRQHDQALFGIIQGGMYPELRRISAEEIIALDFPGYALGGMSVGEPKPLMYEMLDLSAELMPADKPRYLMGVGTPADLVTGVSMGIDMFDCVMPTRNGRNAQVFTWDGTLSIKSAAFKEDFRPIDERCDCYVCRNFSRAYLRHLYKAGEILALRLNTYHNLYFYLELMKKMREAIATGTFESFKTSFLNGYKDNV